MTYKKSSQLILLLIASSFAVNSYAQGSDWNNDNEIGMNAYWQGNYNEAERDLSLALEEAEKFGSNDARLATSLNNLAMLCAALTYYRK